MRVLGIDYGDARVGLAITDSLKITAQGLGTVDYKGNDKMLLKRLDEIFEMYEVDEEIPLIFVRKLDKKGKVLEKRLELPE